MIVVMILRVLTMMGFCACDNIMLLLIVLLVVIAMGDYDDGGTS